MSSTAPPGESLRRALAWIDQARRELPKRNLAELLGEAGMRFALSPAEEEWLLRLLTNRPPGP